MGISVLEGMKSHMLNFGYIYPIGIDIDSHNIFAVQLKDTADGLAIRGLAHAEYEGSVEKASETDGGVVSQLKAITRNRAFRSKRVVVHLPSQHTLAFPINSVILLIAASEKFSCWRGRDSGRGHPSGIGKASPVPH